MKNNKTIFLGAAFTILGGVSLIFGNQILASNTLVSDNQTEPAIVMPEGDPVSAMQLANIGMHSNAGGEAYMALVNDSSDAQKEEAQSSDDTNLSETFQNPTDGIFNEETAKQVGINAIVEKYGLTQEDLSAFEVKVRGRYGAPLPANIANMKPSMVVSEPGPSTEEDMEPSAATNVLIWNVTLTPVNEKDYPTIKCYNAVFDDQSTELMNVYAVPLIKTGTPLENELSSDEAKEIGIAALVKKYALTQKTLDKFTVDSQYYEVNPDFPGKHVWRVNLDPTNSGEFSEIGAYWVYIDAKTGEVLQLNSAANGKG